MTLAGIADKVALVTGAARRRGIGRATALRLAREGAHVACLDIARPYEEFPAYGVASSDELDEVVAEVGLDEERVVEALRFSADPLSLSEPLREGDGVLGDVVEDRSAVSPFEAAAVSLLPAQVRRLLAHLDDREQEILRLRYGIDRGEPRTLEEVGEYFSLTRERIRQIEARAMSKLRHPSSDTGARDLLAV